MGGEDLHVPLAMPSIMAHALFVFMIAWKNRDRGTVSLGLSQLAGSTEIPTTVLMAGSGIVTLPIIVIFFATERLLRRLTAGAEKG
jgi:multiple sugar transport system permease protein